MSHSADLSKNPYDARSPPTLESLIRENLELRGRLAMIEQYNRERAQDMMRLTDLMSAVVVRLGKLERQGNLQQFQTVLKTGIDRGT